jgi:hypothetical protein
MLFSTRILRNKGEEEKNPDKDEVPGQLSNWWWVGKQPSIIAYGFSTQLATRSLTWCVRWEEIGQILSVKSTASYYTTQQSTHPAIATTKPNHYGLSVFRHLQQFGSIIWHGDLPMNPHHEKIVEYLSFFHIFAYIKRVSAILGWCLQVTWRQIGSTLRGLVSQHQQCWHGVVSDFVRKIKYSCLGSIISHIWIKVFTDN